MLLDADPFDQRPWRCRLEWGREGARRAAGRGDIVVIVDVISFATAVATGVAHGAEIVPCGEADDAPALARRVGAELAVGREETPARGQFSLSPLTYLGVSPGVRVVLPSPNGAACSRAAHGAAAVYAGALVNATAVATAVAGRMTAGAAAVTVVAAGERWRSAGEDGPLRPAVEDYLGAGAILAALPFAPSPEAHVCADAFRAARSDLAALLWECGSGRELRARGFGDDVRHAARLDLYDAAPVLRDGRFSA